MKYPFSPDELKPRGESPDFLGGPPIKLFSYPVGIKEGLRAMFERRPIWQIMTSISPEVKNFTPRINPDYVARAFIHDGTVPPERSKRTGGGPDMFGIEWEFIPAVGGSMVRPGHPFISDANEIADKIVWPDIDSWDWAGCKAANQEYLSGPTAICTQFMNGYLERLISFMEFEGAIVAICDEDQQPAIQDFFDKLTDLYIRIVDRMLLEFPQIDMFVLHDDWGSQMNTFFSPAVCREMIVPYMRRFTDHIHAKGRFIELHSCGSNFLQVPNMIAAGFDAWDPQLMNDTEKIYDLYGDQILIGTKPPAFDAATATEEEQRAAARYYVERYCRPDRPSYISMYSYIPMNVLTPIVREEIYVGSRKRYGA